MRISEWGRALDCGGDLGTDAASELSFNRVKVLKLSQGASATSVWIGVRSIGRLVGAEACPARGDFVPTFRAADERHQAIRNPIGCERGLNYRIVLQFGIESSARVHRPLEKLRCRRTSQLSTLSLGIMRPDRRAASKPDRRPRFAKLVRLRASGPLPQRRWNH